LAYFIYVDGEDFEKTMLSYGIKGFTLCCTFLPIQAIGCFEYPIRHLSRIDRVASKINLFKFFVPGIQIQETLIDILVSRGTIPGFNGVRDIYDDVVIVGFVVSFEMMIVSFLMYNIYKPQDLEHWHKGSASYRKSTVSMGGTGYESLADNTLNNDDDDDDDNDINKYNK